MNIGMKDLELLTSIGKDRIDMALLARNLRMQAAQRKCRLAMIKLRLRAQRQPTFAGMAALTRNLQGPVRISVRLCDAGVFLASRRAQQQEEAQEPV